MILNAAFEKIKILLDRTGRDGQVALASFAGQPVWEGVRSTYVTPAAGVAFAVRRVSPSALRLRFPLLGPRPFVKCIFRAVYYF